MGGAASPPACAWGAGAAAASAGVCGPMRVFFGGHVGRRPPEAARAGWRAPAGARDRSGAACVIFFM
jgi:hypothetical protein